LPNSVFKWKELMVLSICDIQGTAKLSFAVGKTQPVFDTFIDIKTI